MRKQIQAHHDDDGLIHLAPPKLNNPLCTDPNIDPEIFFPVSTKEKAAEAAKAICRKCPEIVRCAEFAMTDLRIQGVWGALSWNQRKDLRRQIKLERRK
jgi:WhiB family redox-sensing transcriptional regulator